MRATLYHEFRGPIELAEVPEPDPAPDGAVIQVEATGLCRSDWHGWQGHDPDIRSLPHVPGHEFAGTVVAVGRDVQRIRVGQRVTMPFVAGCGTCPECLRDQQQVCDDQFQAGFTAWGSFAEFVAVRYADDNIVRLPESISSVAAASLGCRFATAYRAVDLQGNLQPSEWVAIHGCGGLGLSAVMIAVALGARVIAVDIRPEPLRLAAQFGAAHTIDARQSPDVPAAIHAITGRGADLSLDALGSSTTFANSILSLRKRGRHVQVGLLVGSDADPRAPMGRVLAWELEIVGSHGLQAFYYPELFGFVTAGKLDPGRLVDKTLSLDEAPAALMELERFTHCGVRVIVP